MQSQYSDSLVTIDEHSITLHDYGLAGGARRVALTDIEEIRVLKPTIWNGAWRLHGTGDFKTWFPADYDRPTRNAIFIVQLKKAWWRIGFTVTNSGYVLRILKEKGLIKESVDLAPETQDANKDRSYKRTVLSALLLVHLCMGPLLLGGALYFRTHLPATINGSYGHRTATSMQNQETWDEAQRYSANAMIVVALVTIACQVASALTMRPVKSIALSFAVIMTGMLAALVLTEWHLNTLFGG